MNYLNATGKREAGKRIGVANFTLKDAEFMTMAAPWAGPVVRRGRDSST